MPKGTFITTTNQAFTKGKTVEYNMICEVWNNLLPRILSIMNKRRLEGIN
jgi:hypothetical protein